MIDIESIRREKKSTHTSQSRRSTKIVPRRTATREKREKKRIIQKSREIHCYRACHRMIDRRHHPYGQTGIQKQRKQ